MIGNVTNSTPSDISSPLHKSTNASSNANAESDHTPSIPSPSYSDITIQSPKFVTPSSLFQTSTPKVSPKSIANPTNVHTRLSRKTKLPSRLEDYIVTKK